MPLSDVCTTDGGGNVAGLSVAADELWLARAGAPILPRVERKAAGAHGFNKKGGDAEDQHPKQSVDKVGESVSHERSRRGAAPSDERPANRRLKRTFAVRSGSGPIG